MILSKSDYKKYIEIESEKYQIKNGFIGNFINYIKYLAGSEKATIWYYQKRLRKTEYYYNTHKRIRFNISKICLNKMSNKYGLHIGLNVFDVGLRIMHLGSILTNGNARVGKNCSIHINTSIVAGGTRGGCPVIGDDVVIGVGATILGGYTLQMVLQ